MKPVTRLLLASLLLAPAASALGHSAAIAAIPRLGLIMLAPPPWLYWWLSLPLLLALLLAYLPLGWLAGSTQATLTPATLGWCMAAGWPLQLGTLWGLSGHAPGINDAGLYLLMLAASCAGGGLGYFIRRCQWRLA